MNSILIQCCSFLYIVLLLFVYFSKKRLNVLENKIYIIMLISNFFGLIIDVASVFTIKYMNTIPLLNSVVTKLYLIYLLTFMFLFTLYILTISIKDKSKGRIKVIKSIKFASFIYCVFFIITSFLPLYYKNNNGVIYSYGPAATFLYLVSTLCMAVWLICTISNLKNIRDKKYLPMFVFFVIGSLVTVIQGARPELLLMTSMESFIIMLMYFTIENPDIKMLQEMAKNNDLVEQAYIDKSNFLFELTGEVKNPLNNIREVTRELEDVNDLEEIKSGLKIINNSIRQLDFVMDNVLNVSSLDVQKVKFMNNRYNLTSLYKDLVSRVNQNIKNGVEFRHSIPNNVPYLYGDSIKLKQVLYSLIMNAVKKTENGFIEFKINTIEKYDVCRVIFEIVDSGVGISLDKINEILSVTGEFDKDDLDSLEKTEFNIKLCQKIVKSLGGNLLIKSKVGHGTEVILTIDQRIFKNEKEDTLKVYENILMNNKRVLVVNQDKNINNLLKKKFLNNDINGSFLMYGMDAIDKIKSGKKYDYILLQDDMKEMSGYETLKKLEELDKFDIPVIIMLRENKYSIKEHYIKDGFSDYILLGSFSSEIDRIINKY